VLEFKGLQIIIKKREEINAQVNVNNYRNPHSGKFDTGWLQPGLDPHPHCQAASSFDLGSNSDLTTPDGSTARRCNRIKSSYLSPQAIVFRKKPVPTYGKGE